MQNASSHSQLQWQEDLASADRRLWEGRRAAHTRRCRDLAPVSADEASRLVERFLAERGGATRCPAAYLAASSAGTPLRRNPRADARIVNQHRSGTPLPIARHALIFGRKIRSWWGPDRRRSGPQLLPDLRGTSTRCADSGGVPLRCCLTTPHRFAASRT
jgi:hypothetical protein